MPLPMVCLSLWFVNEPNMYIDCGLYTVQPTMSPTAGTMYAHIHNDCASLPLFDYLWKRHPIGSWWDGIRKIKTTPLSVVANVLIYRLRNVTMIRTFWPTLWEQEAIPLSSVVATIKVMAMSRVSDRTAPLKITRTLRRMICAIPTGIVSVPKRYDYVFQFVIWNLRWVHRLTLWLAL